MSDQPVGVWRVVVRHRPHGAAGVFREDAVFDLDASKVVNVPVVCGSDDPDVRLVMDRWHEVFGAFYESAGCVSILTFQPVRPVQPVE